MSDLENKVNDCIQLFIATKAEFTAHDVTKQLRQLYPGQDISHAGGVREIVHALFESGWMSNYDRELDYSFGIMPAPWRYFPALSVTVLHPAPGKTLSNKTQAQEKCPTCCSKKMHKKGFGLYHVQRYRCLVCGRQQNELTGTVFHNRKRRPATILDALWCILHGKTNIYTAGAVQVNPKTISTWRKSAKETWLSTSKTILKLDQRFDQTKLDKLKAVL